MVPLTHVCLTWLSSPCRELCFQELMKRFLPHRVDVLNDTEEGRRSLAEIEKRKKAHEKRQKQGMRKDDNE